MSHQEVPHYYFAQLYRLHETICLHLPASPESLRRQIDHLHQAQEALEHLQQFALSQIRQRRSLAARSLHQRFLPFIHQTVRVVENYKLLAEEFPLDPHGSMDCHEKIQQRSHMLLRRLKELEHELLQPRPKSA